MDKILRDASIQRIDYMSKSKESVKKSPTPVFIPQTHESSRLSKLEQIVQNKRSLDESIKGSARDLVH